MNTILLAAVRQSQGTSTFVTLLCVFAAVIFVTLLTVARFYKRCPSDRILVVYGKVKGGRSAHCIHGGGAFIITPGSVETPTVNVEGTLMRMFWNESAFCSGIEIVIGVRPMYA